MIRHILFSLVLAGSFGVTQLYSEEKSKTLTLIEVLQNVELHNPRLQAKKIAINTIKSKERQARAIPNPELGVDAENIYGSGSNQKFDSAEITIQVSEKLELGAKRKARIKKAQIQTQVAILEFEIEKQNIFLTALERYLKVISDAQKLSIARYQEGIQKKFIKTVKKQVQSGRLPKAEIERAETQLLNAKFEVKKIELNYRESLSRLSVLYNKTGHISPFDVEKIPVPSKKLPELMTNSDDFLSQNKQYQLLLLKNAQVKHDIRVEKSLGWQDPTFYAGVKKDNSSNERSYVAGIGIPIGLFDRNKGGIKSAEFHSEEWELMVQDKKNNLNITYEYTFHQANLLLEEADLLNKKILPRTKSIYGQVKKGYIRGKYTYLDVLNAQNDWVEAQKNLVDVLARYWKTRAQLELILGHSIEHQLPKIFSQTQGEKND